MSIAEHEPWLLPYVPEKGDVAVDVGANRGDWARDLAKTHRLVYAIEPNPALYQALAAIPNVVPVACAAGRHPGVVRLNTFACDMHASSVFAEGEDRGRTTGSFLAPVLPLDLIVPEAERVSFVKVDVEGMELDVVMGATGILSRDMPTLLIEVHLTDIGDRIKRVLSGLGYSWQVIRHPHYPPGSPYYDHHYWLYAEGRG